MFSIFTVCLGIGLVGFRVRCVRWVGGRGKGDGVGVNGLLRVYVNVNVNYNVNVGVIGHLNVSASVHGCDHGHVS